MPLNIRATKKYNPKKAHYEVEVVAVLNTKEGGANRTFRSIVGSQEEEFADDFAQKVLEGMFRAIDKPLQGGFMEVTDGQSKSKDN